MHILKSDTTFTQSFISIGSFIKEELASQEIRTEG